MARRGENWRFWLPVVALVGFAAYTSQKMVRAHVDESVKSLVYTGERTIPGTRGAIYDSFGEQYPLVKSVPVWEYHLDPVALTNRIVRRRGEPPRPREAIVKTIASSLSLDYSKVLRMADDDTKRYQFLSVSSDPKAYRTLRDSHLVSGVAIENRQVRQFLHGRHLSHVLGSVNAEFVGSAGLEQKYNSTLMGIDGHVTYMKDALGHQLYDRPVEKVDAIPGGNLYLTIDHNIQYEVETALAEGVAEYGAGSGWCIVMDSQTGAVLAMASLPDFDPKRFGRATDSEKLNRACAFTYEPGSVMKVITASAAIDSGLVTAETMYDTNRADDRYYRLPGDGTHTWPARMSVADAIVHSSNIVIGKLGCDLGPKTLHTYMRAFGFGARTGIELPGEETGILPDWRRWDKASWSRAPIGQYVAVTAIQLVSAYQTIANNGIRMQPYIIDHITDGSGNEIYRHDPREVGRPIKATTAKTMRQVMLGVASPDGTARRAAIRGYSIAGKTGTAQKSAGRRGYMPGLYRATFCGIVPASDPRLVVLVTLDFDEKVKYHQGGNSSAPVFRRITTAALRYLMIPPDRPEELVDAADDGEFDAIVDERARRMGDQLL